MFLIFLLNGYGRSEGIEAQVDVLISALYLLYVAYYRGTLADIAAIRSAMPARMSGDDMRWARSG